MIPRALRWAAVLALSALVLSRGTLAAEDPKPVVAFLAFDDGFWQVWVMNEDGSDQRAVTRSRYDKNRISWDPSGTHIMVNGVQGELNRVDVATGGEQPVPMAMSGMADAVLSPDGKSVAYSLSVAGSTDRNDIWLSDLNGGAPTRLTNMKGLQHEPSWSLDGRAIYFLSGITGPEKQHHDVVRLSLSTGNQEQLTAASGYHFDIAAVRQDTIAYSSNRGGQYDIWLQEGAQQPIRLTTGPELDAKPSFSADGSVLYYESATDGVPNIWRRVLAERDAQQLTHHAVGARSPVWFGGAP